MPAKLHPLSSFVLQAVAVNVVSSRKGMKLNIGSTASGSEVRFSHAHGAPFPLDKAAFKSLTDCADTLSITIRKEKDAYSSHSYGLPELSTERLLACRRMPAKQR